MTVKTKQEREVLRRSFRPYRIRLLFIGESPPASGRFFYCGDSGLYRAMHSAFQTADPGITDDNFLQTFQAYGCYLIDLCQEPVDHLEPPLRRAMRVRGERLLTKELGRLQPEMIAPMLRSITGNVATAVEKANWRGPILQLPYPGRWVRFRDQFVDTLVPVIRQLRAEQYSDRPGTQPGKKLRRS